MHWLTLLFSLAPGLLVLASAASIYRRNRFCLAFINRWSLPSAPPMTTLSSSAGPLPLPPAASPLEATLPPPHARTAGLEAAILDTLVYADVFDYPPTSSEIHRYLAFRRATAHQVAKALAEMDELQAIVHVGECFALPGRSSIAETRRRRAEMSAAPWRQALRYGRLVAALPFVRMVAITGSLAMCNAERDADIDFLLVTVPDRLWTTRAMVILVTRLAKLLRANLCPNYLVTTNALEFHDRSLYVAHEVAQMVPLSGAPIYDDLRAANAWTEAYLPNALAAPAARPQAVEFPRWQRFVEAVLELLPLERFEAWEMKRKIRRLSRQQSSSPEAYFSADVCKGHADRHRQRTEAVLSARLRKSRSL